jgi:L-asparaginase
VSAPSRGLGLVLTGGTVGSRVAATSSGSVVVLDGQDDERRRPQSALIDAVIERAAPAGVRIVRPMNALSENLLPGDWVVIAQAVRDLIENHGVDGVLILHGTDTMAYTAAALSFLLADAPVPIVLTGANLPPEDPRSDAARNVGDALVALSGLDGGTHIAFAGGARSPTWVHLGTRVRKARASGPAFVSVNRQPAGKVTDGRYRPIHPLRRHARPSLRLALEDRVLALRLHPGLDLEAVAGMVETSELRGVVLELYAAATAPGGRGRYSAPEFVARCRAHGVAVVTAVPAVPTGVSNRYATTIELQDAGAVFVRDMLPETALVKLMWALAQTGEGDALAGVMLEPVAEELRPR